MPPPFSQGWVGNIRKLAAAHWWDGLSINRVQDNYVVQWGDADGEDKAKARKLPDGLAVVPAEQYTASFGQTLADQAAAQRAGLMVEHAIVAVEGAVAERPVDSGRGLARESDAYGALTLSVGGFPIASDTKNAWPVHCYGMVGVGRNLSPDTGTGAELYTVIGHAPRHLDRNIALVGRVISGIENLSSLPRGTGALGFYEKPEQRVTITSIRLGNEVADLPRYQYLSTESTSFAKYADARANRRDAFFIVSAGGADICNIPVPVRKAP